MCVHKCLWVGTCMHKRREDMKHYYHRESCYKYSGRGELRHEIMAFLPYWNKGDVKE